MWWLRLPERLRIRDQRFQISIKNIEIGASVLEQKAYVRFFPEQQSRERARAEYSDKKRLW